MVTVHRGVSADEGRQRLLPKKRGHEIGEKPERVPLPHLTGSGNGEDSFGEALSTAGLITEADFAPLNGRPDSSLSCIVGWLDTLNAQEGEKNVPVFEETDCPRPDVFIRAFPVAQARAFHAAPDEGARLPQFFAGTISFLEGMPVAKERSNFF